MSERDNSRIIAGALQGLTLDQIAEASGVSRSTVQRRLKEPEVQRELREGRAQLKAELFGQLTALQPLAISRLRELMEEPEPRDYARGIGQYFSAFNRAISMIDLEDRLAEIEERLGRLAGDDELGPNAGLGPVS